MTFCQYVILSEIDHGKRPDFQGGGLVGSAGGKRTGLLGLKKEERELSDDRILGSGHFVTQVLEKANEVNQKRMDKYSFQTLCQKIISVFGINEEELRSAFKKRAVTEAKASFSYLAIRKMGYSGREVVQLLNMRSYSAIRISEKRKCLLTGPLTGIHSWHFKVGKMHYRIAYVIEKDDFILNF